MCLAYLNDERHRPKRQRGVGDRAGTAEKTRRLRSGLGSRLGAGANDMWRCSNRMKGECAPGETPPRGESTVSMGSFVAGDADQVQRPIINVMLHSGYCWHLRSSSFVARSLICRLHAPLQARKLTHKIGEVDAAAILILEIGIALQAWPTRWRTNLPAKAGGS